MSCTYWQEWYSTCVMRGFFAKKCIFKTILYTIVPQSPKEPVSRNLTNYIHITVFFYRFTAHLGQGFYNLFVQYYSVVCRPSDHTVGRPRAENRTRDGYHENLEFPEQVQVCFMFSFFHKTGLKGQCRTKNMAFYHMRYCFRPKKNYHKRVFTFFQSCVKMWWLKIWPLEVTFPAI